MIIWQGLGFLALLIPVVTYGMVFAICSLALGSNYPVTHGWPGGVGVVLGAVATWLLAKKLDVPGRTLIDPATGRTVVFKKKNTLFWIPMQYVAIGVALFGVGLCFLGTW